MAAHNRFELTLTDEAGNIYVAGTQIRWTHEVTLALPQLYSDYANLTALGNPFTIAPGVSKVAFYSPPGRYKLEAFFAGSWVTLLRDYALGDSRELDQAQAVGALGSIYTGTGLASQPQFLDHNNVIDARLFGVVADGVTNNLIPLANAIAAAAALTYRAVVLLPAGIINLSATITMARGVVLRGQGAALNHPNVPTVKYGTKIQWTGSTTSGCVFDSPSGAVTHSWGVQALTIDGGVAATEVAISGSSLIGIRVRSGFYHYLNNISLQLIGVGISFEPNFALGSPNDLIEYGNFLNIHMFLVNKGYAFCPNATLSNLTSGGTTNNQFFNCTIYAFVTRGADFHAMADDNRFNGGFWLSSANGSYGIEFNSLSPMIETGVYGNTFMNFELQGDGTAQYGIVSGNTGSPTVPYGNSYYGGLFGFAGGAPFSILAGSNGILNVYEDTGLFAQQTNRAFPNATGILISNDYASSAAAAVSSFRTSAGLSGIFYNNSATNTAYAGINSSSILNRLNAAFGIGTNNLIRILISQAGAIKFNTYGTGTLSTNASGDITASDERLKDIKGPSTRGLAEIRKIVPIEFCYKATPGVEAVGLSAQNVQSVMPEAIGHIPDPNIEGEKFLNIDDRSMIAALIGAVKELDRQVTDLMTEKKNANRPARKTVSRR